MSASLREAVQADVPALFEVRVSVRENHESREGLADDGITETAVCEALGGHMKGWVVEESGRVTGFSMADAAEGSIFALFVRPESEGRGYGSRLLDLATEWLFERGFAGIWLTTDSTTRAYEFYLRRGWHRTATTAEGDARLERWNRRSA